MEPLPRKLSASSLIWRGQLADLPVLELPTDRPRPLLPSLRGTFYRIPIPGPLIEDLKKLGRHASSTLFMVTLAAFAALLQRITGQDDIPIGVPVANRTQTATEKIVGTFVNTLVLRVDLSGDPTFHDLLLRVRATALDAFAHQDVSFDRLVQEIRQRRDTNRAPLVQVLLNIANAPMHGIEFDGLTWEPVPLDRGGSQFELSLSIDSEVTRSISIEYNTDLFERATIERTMEQYFHDPEGVVAAPQTRLSLLPLLSVSERALLWEWDATAAPYPQDKIFPQLFEEQVARTPDAPGLSFDRRT